MKFYMYKNCGTCQKAKKFLNARNIKYTEIPIREQPPTKIEIKKMLDKYGIKRLFNTSGQDYRKLGMKDKLPGMNEQEIIALLSNNGNLIKRPFIVDPYLIGFNEEEWVILNQ